MIHAENVEKMPMFRVFTTKNKIPPEPKLRGVLLSVILNIVLMHPADPYPGHLNMHPIPGDPRDLTVYLKPVPNAELPKYSTTWRLTHTDSAPCAGGRTRGIPSR